MTTQKNGLVNTIRKAPKELSSLNNTVFFSVDLGTMRDPTAVTIISRGMSPVSEFDRANRFLDAEGQPKRYQSLYRMRYMERFPLGMDYPSQVERIRSMLTHQELIRKTTLIVDATGVGLPVLQMMKEQGMNPIGIWITAGNNVSNRGADGYNVPKRHLVSALNLVFQSRRLKIPVGLKNRRDFMRELEGFSMKITAAGTDTYEAEVESVHDDLVMSTAYGIWYAEKHYGSIMSPFDGTRGVTEIKNPLEEGL
jgi:hypothetical protein